MAYIGVVGPGEATADEERDAAAIGAGLAGRGHIVLCGGLGGVMAATARGVAGHGGTSVGLLPGGDRGVAAPDLTVVLPTGMGELRNALLVRCSDVVLSVGGSWGTLSEVALAVRTGVPVVALRGWSLPPAPGLVPVASAAAALDEVERLLEDAR